MLWRRETTTNVRWKLRPLLRHAWLARLLPTRIVVSGRQCRSSEVCFELPTDQCLTSGIGPEHFDCSGLVVASLCEVLGLATCDWPMGRRHARDMWQEADDPHSASMFIKTEPREGALLVMRRHYDIGGRRQEVAGHIAVVSCVGDDNLRYIHANPANGIVEERQLKSSRNLLGIVGIM